MIIKLKTIATSLVCLGLAGTASAQNVLTDYFNNSGFSSALRPPYNGTMTLAFDGAPLAAGTTNLLTSLLNYQISVDITGSSSTVYHFDNTGLIAASDVSRVEVITLETGGFVFYNLDSSPGNTYDGSADFVNGASYFTTAPPAFLSSGPYLAEGVSAYQLVGGATLDGLGVYGSGVPEPSTLALCGIGGAALVFFRRRK